MALNGIRYRIIVFVFLPFVFSFSLLMFLIARMDAENSLKRLRDARENDARLVAAVLRESMLVGYPALAKQAIAKMPGGGTRVVVLPGGKERAGGSARGDALLAEAAGTGRPASEMRDGRFRYCSPIPNEKPCRKCHEEKGLIGIISIDASVAPELDALKTTRLTMFFYGLASLGFGTLTLYMVYERYVARPVREIASTLSAYRQLRFTEKIDRRKMRGEFSGVAEIVDGMSEKLGGIQDRFEKSMQRSRLALREQLRLHETLVNSINSGIVFVDMDGKILKINPYALQCVGLAEADAVGRPLDEVVEGFHRDILQHREGEKSFTTAAGRAVRIGYGVTRILEPADLRGKVVLFKDLTEISALRAQVRRKEYFSTIGEMSSWIAHEIKNPVFGISSTAEILLKKCGDPAEKGFLESMMKECVRVNTLLDDLLQYAKPIRLSLQEVDLAAVVRDAASLYEAAARAGGCAIEVADPGADVRAMADPDRVRQVLLNILKNAIEAKARRVAVALRRENGAARVRIADDGGGIARKNLGAVFRPFFTTKRNGTGLGLPICRKIVEEHGGGLSVESREGEGTVVEISLPIPSGAPSAPEGPAGA